MVVWIFLLLRLENNLREQRQQGCKREREGERPLQGKDRIVDGIERERVKLEELRSQADVVIDTSNLNVHQLEKRIGEIFSAGMLNAIRINVLSFGYKYGIPVDADLLLDCRFIPNPHWIPELRPLTGRPAVIGDPGLGHHTKQTSPGLGGP